jgi:hypothetical protein
VLEITRREARAGRKGKEVDDLLGLTSKRYGAGRRESRALTMQPSTSKTISSNGRSASVTSATGRLRAVASCSLEAGSPLASNRMSGIK